MLDRFESSIIPLDDTFGSNSDPMIKPLRLILMISPGVEIDRLNEILKLLEGLGPDFIQYETEGMYRKCIYIGCNDSEDKSIIPLTSQLKKKLLNLKCSPSELTDLLSDMSKLTPLD